jgi:phosphoribosylamine-glycine ligase
VKGGENGGFGALIPSKLEKKDVRKAISQKIWWETWDGLRTFPWREFGVLLEEMIPFAA